MPSPDPTAPRGWLGRVLLSGLIALLVGAAYASWRLAEAKWDPLSLAELGERYALGVAEGSAGYDGQFNYYIASDPNPASLAARLDVPAYRYQRILYPLLARLLAAGQAGAVPWMLLVINLVVHASGTALLATYLESKGLNGLYSLSYGLWVGLIAPVGLDLNEPLSYALVVASWLLIRRDRPLAASASLGLALFAKETALVFWASALVGSFLGDRGIRANGRPGPRPRRRPAAGPAGPQATAAAPLAGQNLRLQVGLIGAGLAFAAWQVWLLGQFGRLGLGSGGEMATPFEWIPFMGLWRIGTISLPVLGLFVVIFGPTLVVPAIWGAIASLRALWAGYWNRQSLCLLFSSAVIAALPFSTFREPLGLVRAADGLVLAVLFFASDQFAAGPRPRWRRPLRLALLWIPLLAILLNR
jgi:hypothetical protein